MFLSWKRYTNTKKHFMLKIAWAKSQRKDTEDEVSNSKSRWLTKTTKRLIKIYEHHWLKQSFTSFLQSNTVIKYKFEKNIQLCTAIQNYPCSFRRHFKGSLIPNKACYYWKLYDHSFFYVSCPKKLTYSCALEMWLWDNDQSSLKMCSDVRENI